MVQRSDPVTLSTVSEHADLEAKLRELWCEVERGYPGTSQEQAADEWDVDVTGFGPGAVVFRGPAIALLHQLITDLSASALSKGGRRPGAAHDLIVETCRRALDESPESAIASFRKAISAAQDRYRVYEDIRGASIASGLTIGASTIYAQMPSELAESPAMAMYGSEFPAGLIVAEVEAYDRESAVFIAQQRFAETRSILALLEFPPHTRPTPAHIVVDHIGHQIFSSARFEKYVPSMITAGDLPRGYAELSGAAAKSAEERTDWETRTLAAARWYREAITTAWQAQRLGALMSALECLLVAPGEDGKGSRIASRLPDQAYPPGQSRKVTRKWILRLYRHRGAAIHEGTDYREDLELDRLESLTRNVINWAVWHLWPEHSHGPPGAPCATFDEARGRDQRS
jgi:hypothetical protein